MLKFLFLYMHLLLICKIVRVFFVEPVFIFVDTRNNNIRQVIPQHQLYQLCLQHIRFTIFTIITREQVIIQECIFIWQPVLMLKLVRLHLILLHYIIVQCMYIHIYITCKHINMFYFLHFLTCFVYHRYTVSTKFNHRRS